MTDAAAQDALLEMLDNVMQHELDFLTELGPLVVCASAIGVSRDTRSFARTFEVAHALAIRECVHLEGELDLIKVDDRNEKSGRRFFELTQKGKHITEMGPTQKRSI